MALIYHDRVRETSTSTGVGDMSLDGAPDATFKSFNDRLADQDTCDVAIFGANDFECCRATYDAGNDALIRGDVYASSNGDNPVSFGAGVKTIVLTLPATRGREIEALGRRGPDIASASETDIWGTEADSVFITGTDTIDSFGTAPRAGLLRWVFFTDVLVIDRDSDFLETHTQANVTTADGDAFLVYAETTTKAVIIAYRRASPVDAFNDIAQEATEDDPGIVELASDAEAIAKVDTNRALTPANLAALGATEDFAGLVEYASLVQVAARTANNRGVTPEGLTALDGKQTIWMPASGMLAHGEDPASAGIFTGGTNNMTYPVFDFDQSIGENVNFSIAMPKSWDKTSFQFQVFWTASAGSGTVRWILNAQRVSDGDTLDSAFSNSQSVDDTLGSVDNLHVAPTSGDLTPGGAQVDDDLIIFILERDPDNDTLNADARLIGIKLFYTENAANDN